jgi:hypothetical protein
MKKIFLPIFLLWICACSNTTPTNEFQRSTPEKEGVSSLAIIDYIKAVEAGNQELHSLMILRHGKVIAEGWWSPFRSDLKHSLYSTSKTFTSTAIGFAVNEKRLTVDDKVISFFPEYLPDSVSENLAKMRVRDLLSMSTGQNPEPTFALLQQHNWVKTFLSAPVPNEPGSVFLYNSAATYMLSAIIQKVTGETLMDYLTPRLFEPLEIEGADWESDPQGINTGGWGLRIKTEDMAKLGQLYLQKGKWNGIRILPKTWIKEATTAKIVQKPDISEEQRSKDDWAQGYCYQIWRCRNNAFRADGAFGQYIIVLPEQDAVIAITANVRDMQKEIDLVWDYLLPAMNNKVLPVDPEAEEALHSKLLSLNIQPSKTGKTSLKEIEFVEETTFVSDPTKSPIKSISVKFENDLCRLTVKEADHEYLLLFGCEKWQSGETKRPCPALIPIDSVYAEYPPFHVCGSYCWEDEQTLSLTLRYIESPHFEQIICTFEVDGISVSTANNINPERKSHFSGIRL